MGQAPPSLARSYPYEYGCDTDALRLAKRLSHARASTVAAFALGHTRLMRLSFDFAQDDTKNGVPEGAPFLHSMNMDFGEFYFMR